jgi:predicted transcriptional regulator
MTRRATTPKEVTKILTLREVGYTTIAIAERLNLSLSTVNRHLSTHGVKKGSLKQEVIEEARNELVKLIISDDAIREAAAKEIADTMAHSSHIRKIMLEASQKLVAKDVNEAALVMRAAAAYSTAIKNTSDTIRHALGTDKVTDDSNRELPVLTITELTAEDVKQLREKQLAED